MGAMGVGVFCYFGQIFAKLEQSKVVADKRFDAYQIEKFRSSS